MARLTKNWDMIIDAVEAPLDQNKMESAQVLYDTTFTTIHMKKMVKFTRFSEVEVHNRAEAGTQRICDMPVRDWCRFVWGPC